jgi:hypothetical protein
LYKFVVVILVEVVLMKGAPMLVQKFLRSFAFGCIFVTGFSLTIPGLSNAQKYRVILPPRPPQPPALNNTVQSQIANQNVGFNTQNQINGFGGGGFGGGGIQASSGGIQGTAQFTQNNSPGSQISALYGIPISSGGPVVGGFGQGGGGGGFGQGGGFGGGGFGQGGGGQFGQGGGGFGGGQFGQGGGGGGFGQGSGTGGQAVGMNNPFYQMAMQGIMSGVGGSAFQSGGGGNMGGQNMAGGFGGGQFGGGQFGGGQFGQFGGGGNGGGGNNQAQKNFEANQQLLKDQFRQNQQQQQQNQQQLLNALKKK